MKKWVYLLVCVLISSAYAGLPVYYTEVYATDVSSSIAPAITNYKVYNVNIENDGPYDVYINLNGATATTSNRRVRAGEAWATRSPGGFDITSASFICASGQTATVRFTGYPYP